MMSEYVEFPIRWYGFAVDILQFYGFLVAQIIVFFWQHEIERMSQAKSHQDILYGAAGCFVCFQEENIFLQCSGEVCERLIRRRVGTIPENNNRIEMSH